MTGLKKKVEKSRDTNNGSPQNQKEVDKGQDRTLCAGSFFRFVGTIDTGIIAIIGTNTGTRSGNQIAHVVDNFNWHNCGRLHKVLFQDGLYWTVWVVHCRSVYAYTVESLASAHTNRDELAVLAASH
jgi:hypothetical protein